MNLNTNIENSQKGIFEYLVEKLSENFSEFFIENKQDCLNSCIGLSKLFHIYTSGYWFLDSTDDFEEDRILYSWETEAGSRMDLIIGYDGCDRIVSFEELSMAFNNNQEQEEFFVNYVLDKKNLPELEELLDATYIEFEPCEDPDNFDWEQDPDTGDYYSTGYTRDYAYNDLR